MEILREQSHIFIVAIVFSLIIVGATPGITIASDNEVNATALAVDPSHENATSTHTWTVGELDLGSDELDSVTIDYSGTDTDLSKVDRDNITVSHNPDTVDRQIRVNSGGTSFEDGQATLNLDGRQTGQIESGDTLQITVDSVDNPSAGEHESTLEVHSSETQPLDTRATSFFIDSSELEVHSINVGQADATLIIAPNGETVLIDSGDWRNNGETVIDYLETHDIDRIDHLIATHAHADHIGGHAAIINHYETERNGIGAVWDSGVPHTSQVYDRYLDAIEEHNVTLYETREGDTIPFEDDRLTMTVLNPPEESDRPGDLHYNSVSVLLEFDDTTVLFTGDAERAAEERMVDTHGDTIEADIYHAGHHGSATSSTASFIDAVDPDATIISAGYENQYGFPHEEPLAEFDKHNVMTHWTGVHGTMVYETDGEDWIALTQTNATTDPLEIRDEPEAEMDPTDEPTYEEPVTSTERSDLSISVINSLFAAESSTIATPLI